MSNQEKEKKRKEYNDIPVYYCKRCLSLNIMNYNNALISCYCKDCTSIDIDSTNIENWLQLYKEKYKNSKI